MRAYVAVLAGLSFVTLTVLWCGCEEQLPPSPPKLKVTELVVITPHSPAIQETFSDGFRKWQEKRENNHAITIRWIHKGTLDCQRYIYDRYGQFPDGASKQCGIDVFFGGGLAIHEDIAARGYAEPIKLPEAIISAIPEELNGQPLYAPDGSWYGSALGGYGILFNKEACIARGVPVPSTWSDLAKSEYTGWVAAADPFTSGSTTQCLVLSLLKHGWDEGWGVLTGILANCNGLLASSSYIGPNVMAGVALAGMEPEFVAQMSIDKAPEALDYINPPAATAITPDPITILAGAPNAKSARCFVEFVLSQEGQALWALPPDMPDASGSQSLHRYPIRPDVYEKYDGQLTLTSNPFKQRGDFRIDPQENQAYTKLLPHLVKAACGPNHYALQKAWMKAQAEGANSANFALLRQPPFEKEKITEYAETCANNPEKAAALVEEWSKLFAKRYSQVLGQTP